MTTEELKGYLASHFGDRLRPFDTGRHDLFVEAEPSDLIDLCRSLRDDETLRFDYLCNISGVDTGERFEIVYSLASTVNKLRLDLKINPERENPEVDSVQEIWPGANWYEREIWELYGINIRNHDNLTRFLLPEDWDQGHPLRKDWDAPDFVRMPEL